MFSSLAELQKERGFPHPSRKKKLLTLKRESTHIKSSPVGANYPALRDQRPGSEKAFPFAHKP
jgi:hypothetical protein